MAVLMRGWLDSEPAAAPVSTAVDGGFNQTDVMFLQMSVPHHRARLEIVALANTRVREVKTSLPPSGDLAVGSGLMTKARGLGAAEDDDPQLHAGHAATTG
ncbi:hypothetical protein K7G98_13525 [Saccharothrix sp. MB29]|nr:hypothetical protein [Saccharothrix sp. MB29]